MRVALWTVLCALPVASPASAANCSASTQNIIFTTSTKEIDHVTPASVTDQVNTFQVELKARMEGNSSYLFDQNYNVAFSDPTVQAAVTQAEGILTAAGAASFTGPTQLSSNSSTTSSVSTANSTTATNVSSVTTEYTGPTNVMTGDNQSQCVSLSPGRIDFDTLITSDVFITETTTTTNTTLTSQVYEIDGLPAGAGPTITAVANTYNVQGGLSPGAVATITGTNFGSVAANVSVSVGGKAAYVYPSSVTPTALQIEIPTELSAGPTTVTVTVSGAPSNAFAITLAAYAPTCQPQDSSGSGLAKVFTSATSLVTLGAPAQPNDQLALWVSGLGPTNPPTPTGVAASSNSTPSLPTVTIGGASAQVTSATVIAGNAGLYKIVLTVPAGVQGTAPVVIGIGGTNSSTTCTIALAGLSAVVNNASFASPGIASPGAIETVFANALGTSTDQLAGLFPLSKSEGVQTTFNTEAAPMFHIVASTAQQQVDLLVPTDLPTSGTVNVQLNSYPNYMLTMVPANPGIYRIPDPKVATRFNVIAQFANTTWLALPVSTTTALGLPACTKTTGALVVCGQPATTNDYLVLYVTGLGLATPGGDPGGKPLATGQVAPVDGSVLYKTPTLPTVTVGGVQANVLFSGLAPGFAGLYQIDIQVPPGVASSDDVPVKVTMLGASDTATISIQPRGN